MVVMEMAAIIRSIMTGPSPIIPLREMGNGSYTFDHPVWGTDTLTNIDGLWFGGEGQWYAVDEGLLA